MRVRTISAGVATAALGIALVVIPQSAAFAGPVTVAGITTHIVTATGTAPVNNWDEAVAKCPNGQLRLGGGYSIDSTATDWQVMDEAPTGTRGWTATIINYDLSQTLNYSVYAVCAKNAPGKNGLDGLSTTTVYTAKTTPASVTDEADVSCAAGQVVTGGGYAVTNISPNYTIYVNAELNTSTWLVEIDNEVPATTDYDAYAVCLCRTNGKPLKNLALSVVATHSTAPANGAATGDAACPATSLMTGGGFQNYSIGQDYLTPQSAPVSATTWRSGITDLDSFDREFDTFAFCLTKA